MRTVTGGEETGSGWAVPFTGGFPGFQADPSIDVVNPAFTASAGRHRVAWDGFPDSPRRLSDWPRGIAFIAVFGRIARSRRRKSVATIRPAQGCELRSRVGQ